MCGKFTAMASWRELVAFSQPLTKKRDGSDDEEVTYGVEKPLPVIVWDREAGKRMTGLGNAPYQFRFFM